MRTSFLTFILAVFCLGCGSKKEATDAANAPETLNGSWELNYIANTKLDAKVLYANRKPFILFNTKERKVSGNTGCNSFTGMIGSMGAGEIRFDGENMIMTKMFCPGEGEPIFLQNLNVVSAFSLSDNGTVLHLTDGKTDLMRLTKK